MKSLVRFIFVCRESNKTKTLIVPFSSQTAGWAVDPFSCAHVRMRIYQCRVTQTSSYTHRHTQHTHIPHCLHSAARINSCLAFFVSPAVFSAGTTRNCWPIRYKRNSRSTSKCKQKRTWSIFLFLSKILVALSIVDRAMWVWLSMIMKLKQPPPAFHMNRCPLICPLISVPWSVS